MAIQGTQYKLQVIAGLHKGAELMLREELDYSLGSGEDCDIVLLDDDIADTHLFFRISMGQVTLFEVNADTLIDGHRTHDTPQAIALFQIVSAGSAHLAIGPAHAPWPEIEPPPRAERADSVHTRELVPVFTQNCLPQQCRENRFRRFFKNCFEWLGRCDRRLLAGTGAFMLALAVFVGDTWLSSDVMVTVKQGSGVYAGENKEVVASPASPLLSLWDGIQSARLSTLINTGLVEPAVPTETHLDAPDVDPVDHIRQALRTTWGDRLTEIAAGERDVQFKGFDAHQRQNLRVDLEANAQGDIEAKAVTLTPKKKKEILSQIGDLIRVKVDLAEDMESVCQGVLMKKGIRKGRARYDIQENAFTLEGQSNDADAIDTVSDIIAKAFPHIRVKNNIHKQIHKPARASIKAVSTSGLPFVILNDGSKVFTGGKLDNGCTIAAISGSHILMDCNGLKRRQSL
jgi:hypothetical protein